MGGGNYESPSSVTTDLEGNILIAGSTISLNNIASTGAHQSLFQGRRDAFLAKFNTNSNKNWSTYYGGKEYDEGTSCATDAGGNVYLAGETESLTNISTTGMHQVNHADGYRDGFLVKFNSGGLRIWGTYYGGSSSDHIHSCAIDKFDNVFVCGYTYSQNNISTAGTHQPVIDKGWDAFLAKFNNNGTRIWGTYFGGEASERAISCTTDGFGNVYISGNTDSKNNIATSGAFQTNFLLGSGSGYHIANAFLAKFSSTGILFWATYYGENSQGEACATDFEGNIYLTGLIRSDYNISTPGAHQEISGGGTDAFLVKFDSLGERKWGTFIGGGNIDFSSSCYSDEKGGVLIAGQTESLSNIATSNIYQEANGGGRDAFLMKFDPNGNKIWGTYYGGNKNDLGKACTIDKNGSIFLAGETNSLNQIASSDGYSSTLGGSEDVFLVKFDYCKTSEEINSTTCNSYTAPDGQTYTSSGTYTAELKNHEACGADSILTLTINLTILESSQSSITPSSCNSYTAPDGKTYSQSGKYRAIISNAAGCDSIIEIDLSIHNAQLILESKDTRIFQGTFTPLKASGAVSYSWFPTHGLSCTDCPEPLAGPETTTTYYVTATDENGCTAMDSVTVFVDRDLRVYVPNIFSPNGDGQNDVLYVRGKGIRDLQFSIYNRWGEKVFETHNINHGWDGTFKGEPSQPGVFVYQVDAILENGQRVLKKGDVSLIR